MNKIGSTSYGTVLQVHVLLGVKSRQTGLVQYAGSLFLHNLFNLVRMFSQEQRSEVKGLKAVEYVTSISPIINTGLTPAPPPPQQKGGNTVRSEVTRGR